jgi:hypothetical protein
LDIAYLSSLSEDALPTLADEYNQADSPDAQQAIAGVIACHAALNDGYDYQADPYQRYSWRSFHFSRNKAQNLWQDQLSLENNGQFSVLNSSVDGNKWDSYIMLNGEQIPCYAYRGD